MYLRTIKYGTIDQRERVFRDHFEQTFKNAEIKLIQIKESVLFDEFDVMTVMIVYDSPEELDLDGTMSFVGDILPKLHEINRNYISKYPI